jgi:hypothetical protein
MAIGPKSLALSEFTVQSQTKTRPVREELPSRHCHRKGPYDPGRENSRTLAHALKGRVNWDRSSGRCCQRSTVADAVTRLERIFFWWVPEILPPRGIELRSPDRGLKPHRSSLPSTIPDSETYLQNKPTVADIKLTPLFPPLALHDLQISTRIDRASTALLVKEKLNHYIYTEVP